MSSSSSPPPVYMTTVSAPTNIACIKYWGKASVEFNTPINDSVSVTLDQSDLRAVTTAAVSTSFTHDRLWLNGVEEANAATNPRFRACLDQMKQLAGDLVDPSDPSRVLVPRSSIPSLFFHVSSYNTFPTAAGMASSAAGYAALVAALAQLLNAQETYPGQFSAIARQGSGSACRSLYGGFVAWRKGSAENQWKSSIAQQVADERHWPELRAVVCVVSDDKKDTSSTVGMRNSVETSRLLQHRAKHVVPERMAQIEKAYLEKDFTTFARLTMQDSNQFHAVCLDTYPPIFYMNDTSKSIIRILTVYNQWAAASGLRAGYTYDAGPNAVIYTLEQHAVEVGALLYHYFPAAAEQLEGFCNNPDFLKEIQEFELDPELLKATQKCGRTPQTGDVKMMYYTKSGPGPQTLGPEEANLDPITGLNTYEAKK